MSRLDWVPDPKYLLHRCDIFMVNTTVECPTCGGHSLSKQLLVYPTPDGLPRYDAGLIDTGFLTDEDVSWIEAQCRELAAKFPKGHEFWVGAI